MSHTLRSSFPDRYCADCGKLGGCYIKHWGSLVPEGVVAYFDECFIGRTTREVNYDSVTGERVDNDHPSDSER
jgi:hypothetical protein